MDDSGLERHLELHPFDVQTLLVYADWLEERGDRRAPFYRTLGMGGVWAFGPADRSRPRVVDALRCGVSTSVTLANAEAEFHLDAERLLFEFSTWCAWEVVNQAADPPDPRLRSLLEQNTSWLRDGSRRPSIVSDSRDLREIRGRENAVCRMAVYDVALSGAKLNSRFAEAAGFASVSYPAQNFKLMRMLIDAEGWSDELVDVESAAETPFQRLFSSWKRWRGS